MYVVFLVACFCYGPLQIRVLECKLADLSIIRKFDVTVSVLVDLVPGSAAMADSSPAQNTQFSLFCIM